MKKKPVGAVSASVKRSFLHNICFPTSFYFSLSDMFKNLGTWLGLESPVNSKTTPDDTENVTVEQDEKVVEAQNEVNKQQPPAAAAGEDGGREEEKQQNSEQGKGLGGEN